jgi:PAS domain S-box-containing protein
LQEAHDRLKATLEALPDLLFVLDRDGRILEYHAPQRDRLYLPPEQFLGRRMADLLPEPAAGIIARALADALENGHHHGSRYPLTTPRGESWFEISIAVQGDRHAPDVRLVAITRDITQRQSADEALRENEARFRLLTEGLKDVVWVFDVESRRFTYISPSVFALRGYTPEEILARPYEEALVPAQRQEIANLLEHAVARFLAGEIDDQYFFNLEIVQPCKDGGTVPSEAVCRIVQNQVNGRLEIHGLTRDMSARVRAEEAVRGSERRLRQIIDLVPHFIFAKDAAGRFILANRALAETYGTTVEKLVGATDAQFDSSEEEVRHFREDDLAVIQSGRPRVVPEETITDSTGQKRFLTTTKIPFTTSGTPQPAVLGVAVDITERKRAEDALRESESRFDEIARRSRTIVWEMNAEGVCTYVSPAVEEVLGYRPEEVVGKLNFKDMFHPDRREEFLAAVMEVFQQKGDLLEFENLCQAKDGRALWVSTTAHPMMDATGTLRGYQGSVVDIDRRKRAEEELRHNETRFSEIVRQSRTLVWEMDMTGLYTYMGPVVADVLGYRPEELVGKLHFYDLHPAEGREAFKAAAMEIASRVSPFRNLENPMVAKDGRIVWVSTNAEPIRGADGRPCGYRGSDLDITERKQAEAALRIFKESVENSSDAVGMSTPEGKHYYQNRAFDELFGPVGENPPDTLYVDPAVGRGIPDDHGGRPMDRRGADACPGPAHPGHPAAGLRQQGRDRADYGFARHPYGHHRAQAGGGGLAGLRGEVPAAV